MHLDGVGKIFLELVLSTILLSIKPEYVHRILDCSKKYEFRRSVAKRKVDRILIYSTAPEMKVVAMVEVLDICLSKMFL